jgi:hypothetical protein
LDFVVVVVVVVVVVHTPAEFSSNQSLRRNPGFGNPWSRRKTAQ